MNELAIFDNELGCFLERAAFAEQVLSPPFSDGSGKPSANVTGLSHDMMSAGCTPKTCPWLLGLRIHDLEYGIPIELASTAVQSIANFIRTPNVSLCFPLQVTSMWALISYPLTFS